MKTSPFLSLVVVVMLSSCGGSKPDMSQPAITGVRTPVYEGMVSAMRGSQYAWLNPLTIVYVQSDSMLIGDTGFVRVWWNDSTGYVPAGWTMLNGRKGVLSVSGTCPVYADPELTIPGDATLGDWQLIPIGNVTDKSAQTMYEIEGEAVIGYIERERVFLDTIDVAFYVAYQQADGKVDAYNEIKADDRWVGSILRPLKFEDSDLARTVAARNTNWHMKPVWHRDERNLLGAGEIPGEFALHYVWEDSTLSEINHFGDTLGNSYESCMPEFHKQVAKYKLVFIPKEPTDFQLEADVPEETGTEVLVKEFTNVVPGTMYSLFISTDGYYHGCMPIEFRIRMQDERFAVGSVDSSCGD